MRNIRNTRNTNTFSLGSRGSRCSSPGMSSGMSSGLSRASARGASIGRAARRLGAALALCAAFAGVAHANTDVNTADETALTSVKGIGPATAKRIIDERTKGGAFKDAGDLADRVPGVGPKSVANLQEAGLTIGRAGPAPAAARKDAKTAPKAAR